jgi:hypothetical protein
LLPVQAKLAQLRAHAEEMLQGVLQNPKLSSTELAQLAEHERCAPHGCCFPWQAWQPCTVQHCSHAR